MKVKINDVRGSFLKVFVPESIGGGGPMYSGAFPITPNSENHKLLSAAMEAEAKAKWKDKAPAVLAELKAKGRVGFKESALSKDGEVYDGFEGMFSLNASNKAQPLIVGQEVVFKQSDKKPGRQYTDPNKTGAMFLILEQKDGKPYNGCNVNVSVEVWAQDNEFGKRVNCQLKGVQFVSDNDAFGGGAPASADDFSAITEGADAGDLV